MPEDYEIPEAIPVPLDHLESPGLVTRWVNHMTVQHGPDHFIVSFYEVIPPLLLDETPEARLERARGIESMPAKCVARVVISARNIDQFLEALVDNRKKHRARFERQDEVGEVNED